MFSLLTIAMCVIQRQLKKCMHCSLTNYILVTYQDLHKVKEMFTYDKFNIVVSDKENLTESVLQLIVDKKEK